ncbi:hypothetical protein HF086_008789 [Spodoptera exigua]|uniref:Peptidase S1 domain-containing protein n=1 Tax=Spodoptera exigua TaxID=7107 RepID=A0A922MJ45_SPOEX|nr:hypothetical protein HF086_008789 [Spodoptera exigua]
MIINDINTEKKRNICILFTDSMKVLAVIWLSLAALASARNIGLEDVIDLEKITSYNYFNKIGIALAEKIRKAEEEAEQNPSRIAGGSAASLGQFPYQAGLLVEVPGGTGTCGGSLLNSRRVLTAAHCWNDGQTQARRFTVVLGSVRLFSGGVRLATTSVAMHGSWNPSLARNDIAMITLPSAVSTSTDSASITYRLVLPPLDTLMAVPVVIPLSSLESHPTLAGSINAFKCFSFSKSI